MAIERAWRVPRCTAPQYTVPYTGQVANPVLLIIISAIDLVRPAVLAVSGRPFYRLVVILVLMIVLVLMLGVLALALKVPGPALPELPAPPLHWLASMHARVET